MRSLAVLSFLLSSPLFALVNIAPVDVGSQPGISGNVAGSLSSKSGNTEKDDYSLALRLQYDQSDDYVVWGTLTYDYGTSNGTKNEDRTYAHVRYIRTLDHNDWCGELFVQSEQDAFKDIKSRSLAGAGVRWRFFNSEDWGKGYAGIGGFHEEIDYTHPELNPDEQNGRLNSYIAYTQKFYNASKLSYIGYFQPQFEEVSDYVTSQTLELLVPIYGKLHLSLTANYLYDARPPMDVHKKDTAFITSLLWAF
ncbi:MAG TPA: DUF481 domain-containing protein [Sulfuricurvum sp.]|nr:DUF481 domain-containing protein [Sulfuricurvum sp.]